MRYPLLLDTAKLLPKPVRPCTHCANGKNRLRWKWKHCKLHDIYLRTQTIPLRVEVTFRHTPWKTFKSNYAYLKNKIITVCLLYKLLFQAWCLSNLRINYQLLGPAYNSELNRSALLSAPFDFYMFKRFFDLVLFKESSIDTSINPLTFPPAILFPANTNMPPPAPLNEILKFD